MGMPHPPSRPPNTCPWMGRSSSFFAYIVRLTATVQLIGRVGRFICVRQDVLLVFFLKHVWSNILLRWGKYLGFQVSQKTKNLKKLAPQTPPPFTPQVLVKARTGSLVRLRKARRHACVRLDPGVCARHQATRPPFPRPHLDRRSRDTTSPSSCLRPFNSPCPPSWAFARPRYSYTRGTQSDQKPLAVLRQ